jgi:hypothetical protein
LDGEGSASAPAQRPPAARAVTPDSLPFGGSKGRAARFSRPRSGAYRGWNDPCPWNAPRSAGCTRKSTLGAGRGPRRIPILPSQEHCRSRDLRFPSPSRWARGPCRPADPFGAPRREEIAAADIPSVVRTAPRTTTPDDAPPSAAGTKRLRFRPGRPVCADEGLVDPVDRVGHCAINAHQDRSSRPARDRSAFPVRCMPSGFRPSSC